MISRKNSASAKKPKPYRPPLGDIRNTRRGAEELARMIAESEAKDKEKGASDERK